MNPSDDIMASPAHSLDGEARELFTQESLQLRNSVQQSKLKSDDHEVAMPDERSEVNSDLPSIGVLGAGFGIGAWLRGWLANPADISRDWWDGKIIIHSGRYTLKGNSIGVALGVAQVEVADQAALYAMSQVSAKGKDRSGIVATDDAVAEMTDNARIVARDRSLGVLRDSASGKAEGRARLQTFDRSTFTGHDHCTIYAHEKSSGSVGDHSTLYIYGKGVSADAKDQSSVLLESGLLTLASGEVSVQASGDSQVKQATDSTRLFLRDSSEATLTGKAYANAADNTHVTAGESSSVMVHGSGRVDASEQANVLALEDAKVNFPSGASSAKLTLEDRAKGEIGREFYGEATVRDQGELHTSGSGKINLYNNASLIMSEASRADVVVHPESEAERLAGEIAKPRILASGKGRLTLQGNSTTTLEESFCGEVVADGSVNILAKGAGKIKISGSGTVELTETFHGSIEADGKVKIVAGNGAGVIRIAGDAQLIHTGKGGRIFASEKAKVLSVSGAATVEARDDSSISITDSVNAILHGNATGCARGVSKITRGRTSVGVIDAQENSTIVASRQDDRILLSEQARFSRADPREVRDGSGEDGRGEGDRFGSSPSSAMKSRDQANDEADKRLDSDENNLSIRSGRFEDMNAARQRSGCSGAAFIQALKAETTRGDWQVYALHNLKDPGEIAEFASMYCQANPVAIAKQNIEHLVKMEKCATGTGAVWVEALKQVLPEASLFHAAGEVWHQMYPERPIPLQGYNADFHKCLDLAMDALIMQVTFGKTSNLTDADCPKLKQLCDKYGASKHSAAPADTELAQTTERYGGTQSFSSMTVTAEERQGRRLEQARNGITDHQSSDNRQRLLDLLKQQLKELGANEGDTNKQDLERLKLAYDKLLSTTELPPSLERAVSKTLARGTEAAGTVIGIGIITSAVLAWYLRSQSGNTVRHDTLPEFGTW